MNVLGHSIRISRNYRRGDQGGVRHYRDLFRDCRALLSFLTRRKNQVMLLDRKGRCVTCFFIHSCRKHLRPPLQDGMPT